MLPLKRLAGSVVKAWLAQPIDQICCSASPSLVVETARWPDSGQSIRKETTPKKSNAPRSGSQPLKVACRRLVRLIGSPGIAFLAEACVWLKGGFLNSLAL